MHTLKTEPRALELPATSRWKYVYVAPKELVDYGVNEPRHSTKQIDRIAKTLREHGFTLPIVTDGGDSVISGVGRVAAARRLRLKKIPTLPLSFMTEEERRLLSIGLIRMARRGNWDDDTLRNDVRALPRMQLNTLIKINGGFCDCRGNMSYPEAQQRS